jgi:hypothetical protein
MEEEDDKLFGSDNEEDEEKKKEEDEDDDDDMKIKGASKEKESALFGSDDEEEGDEEEKGEREEKDEDGEDGRSRFSSKQQDLDDLFGDNTESLFTSTPAVAKKPITVSKLCIPTRNFLPEPSACMAIKMPNFVKIAPVCFDPDTLDVQEESRIMGGATSVIRWRYKVDSNGDMEMDSNGDPVKESNARLVKLVNGTYKLLVGDATFHTSIHKTEKR